MAKVPTKRIARFFQVAGRLPRALSPGVVSSDEGAMRSGVVANDSATALPVAHRLAIVYLMLPVMIWLVGWFHWWLGLPAVLLLALALRKALLGSWRVSPRPVIWVLLLIAFGWVMATAAGGVFDINNPDMEKHRAILFDLARGNWPTYLPTYLDLPVLLRYYLGYYMVPGLLASWFGVAALNWSVALWTWCGVALALLLFTRAYHGWKVIAAAAIFIFFGEIDHLIPGWEFDDYSSMLKHLMYNPQHFIAGALYVLLLVQLRRHAQFLGISGTVVATSLFWSPLVAIGLLPLVAVLVIENGLRPFLRWQNVLAAFPLAAILLIYLASESSYVPRDWVWERYDWLRVAAEIEVVSRIGYLLLVILLMFLRPALRREPLLLACLAVILLAPWYSYGIHNDWPRHVTLPALVVLCYFCAETLVRGWGDYLAWYRRIALAIVVAMLAIGPIAPTLSHLSRAFENREPRVFRHEQLGQDYSIFQAVEPIFHNQYGARVSTLQRRLLREDGLNSILDRGMPIIDSDYDVFLNGKRLVYIRSQCNPTDAHTRFILHVIPRDRSILGNREHDNKDFIFAWNGMLIGDTCIVVQDLPAYDISSFTTGQYSGEGAPTGHKWIATYEMN